MAGNGEFLIRFFGHQQQVIAEKNIDGGIDEIARIEIGVIASALLDEIHAFCEVPPRRAQLLRKGDERPLIARVFLNRLHRGMRLQTDPTVIYGLTDFDGNLRKKDLQTPTPYNTYQIRGLPPGPIGSPGRAAIAAVLHPAKESYLYFVSKNDGTHYFSRSLVEHNQAVDKYQKSRRYRNRRPATPAAPGQ